MSKIFDKIIKETYSNNYVLNRVKSSIEAIEKTEDPAFAILKWRTPLAIILEALSKYSSSLLLKEAKTNFLKTPNLPDIEIATDFYNQKLQILIDNFNPKKTKFSDISSLSIDKEEIIQMLKYAIRAVGNSKDTEERQIIMDVICAIIRAANYYIRIINSIFTEENTRRAQIGVKPLELIELITMTDLSPALSNRN